jgi:hypothetical protein
MAGSLVKSVMLKIVADDGDAERKLEQVSLKADELARKHPELKVRIDTAAATAKVAILRHELKAAGNESASSGGLFSRLSGLMSNLGTKTGQAAATAGQFAAQWGSIGIGIALVAAPLINIAAAVGAFAVVAVPELSKVQAALGKTGAAGKKAWAQLTPGERQVGGELKGLMGAFHGVQQALQPVIDHTLALAAGLGKALMPALQSLAGAGARTLNNFIKPLTAFASSGSFRSLIAQVGQFSVQAMKAFGPSLISIMKQSLQILVSFSPAGIKLTQSLLKVTVALMPLINLIARLSGALATGLIAPLRAATIIITGFDRAGHDLTAHWRADWQAIVTTTANAAQSIISGVSRTVSTVTGWFRALPGRIRSALVSLPGMLFSIGRDAIQGLINGALSMGGSLISAGEHLASSFVSSVAGFLHIGSPSRVMFEHGVWAAQGFIGGLDSYNSQVSAAAARMSRAALPGHGGGSGGGGGPGGPGGVTVEIHVPRGGEMLGQEFWTALGRGIRVRGGDPAILQRKVKFA